MNIHRNSVYLLVVAVLGLVVLGLVMLSSTSPFAPESHGNAAYLVQRQAMYLGLGIGGCMFAAMFDYHHLQKTWFIWFGLAVVLLVLCFVPHVGHRMNGASRWLKVAGFTFQPSEVAKLAAVITIAWWFARERTVATELWKGFCVPLGFAGLLMGLIAPEVDMGSTALIGATTFILMFVAGTRLVFLGPVVLAGFGGLAYAVSQMPERMGRFLAFLYPEKYEADAYQQLQGLIALGSGGTDGLGLGNGRQKMAYLPFAHTDFIFPVIGEELGLRCTLLVVFAYIILILAGGVIAMRARDRFGMLLGFGIVLLIALQAAVNIGVTTSLLPNKGLPLPFISYGGTNLVFCLLGVGVLINIYRQGLSEKEQTARVILRARTKVVRRL